MVLGVIRTSTEDEYLITHFRGRLLYEFVHYVVNERGGKLVNQSKLLRKAITCFEDVSFYLLMFVINKISYIMPMIMYRNCEISSTQTPMCEISSTTLSAMALMSSIF